MRVLLVSDTHGNNEILDLLVKTYPDIDIYLHLGDSESDEYSLMPFRSVRGNCDRYPNFPENLLIPTPYGNMLAMHVPYVRDAFLKEHDVKIFVHGHTHRRKYAMQNRFFIVNPGAISYPRDSFDGSFAIMEISEKDVDVTFHTIEEIISKK